MVVQTVLIVVGIAVVIFVGFAIKGFIIVSNDEHRHHS